MSVTEADIREQRLNRIGVEVKAHLGRGWVMGCKAAEGVGWRNHIRIHTMYVKAVAPAGCDPMMTGAAA